MILSFITGNPQVDLKFNVACRVYVWSVDMSFEVKFASSILFLKTTFKFLKTLRGRYWIYNKTGNLNQKKTLKIAVHVKGLTSLLYWEHHFYLPKQSSLLESLLVDWLGLMWNPLVSH